MKLMEYFADFGPIDSEVKKIVNFLVMAYPIKQTTNFKEHFEHEFKYISLFDDVDIIFLNGPFSNKSRFVNKLYPEVFDKFPNVSEASIRKAIKDFFDYSSKKF